MSFFQVNDKTAGAQNHPGLVGLGSDGLACFFPSRDDVPTTGHKSLFGTVLSSDGSRRVAELKIVQSQNGSSESHPAVTQLRNGNLALSWAATTPGQPTKGRSIKVKILTADLATVTDDTPVSENGPNISTHSHVAALGDGGFVVVWLKTGKHYGEVWGRTFDKHGRSTSAATLIDDSSPAFPFHADVAQMDANRFVVSWTVRSQSGGAQKFQLLNRRLIRLSPQFYAESNQPIRGAAQICRVTPDQFCAVWIAGPGSVRGALFETGGRQIGQDFEVDSLGPDADIGALSIAARSDGHFIVSWCAVHMAPQSQSIKVRHFSPGGTPIGQATTISPTDHETVEGLTVREFDKKRFAVAWGARRSDRSDSDVFCSIVSRPA